MTTRQGKIVTDESEKIPVLRLSDDHPTNPKVIQLWCFSDEAILDIGGIASIPLGMWRDEDVARFFAVAAITIDPEAVKRVCHEILGEVVGNG